MLQFGLLTFLLNHRKFLKEEYPMKKLLALVLTLVMIFALAVPVASAEEKTVLNIWSFTDEVPNMISK